MSVGESWDKIKFSDIGIDPAVTILRDMYLNHWTIVVH